MHRSSVPNRTANSSSPAIRSPLTDRSYATLARDPPQEHLANLCYLDRDIETIAKQRCGIQHLLHIGATQPRHFTLAKPHLQSAVNGTQRPEVIVLSILSARLH